MDRICSQCKESKVKEDFLRTAGGNRHPYCNKCRRVYMNKNNQRISKLKKIRIW